MITLNGNMPSPTGKLLSIECPNKMLAKLLCLLATLWKREVLDPQMLPIGTL